MPHPQSSKCARPCASVRVATWIGRSDSRPGFNHAKFARPVALVANMHAPTLCVRAQRGLETNNPPRRPIRKCVRRVLVVEKVHAPEPHVRARQIKSVLLLPNLEVI